MLACIILSTLLCVPNSSASRFAIPGIQSSTYAIGYAFSRSSFRTRDSCCDSDSEVCGDAMEVVNEPAVVEEATLG